MSGGWATALGWALVAVACSTSGAPQSASPPVRGQVRLGSSRGDAVSVSGAGGLPGLVVLRERGIGGATVEVVGAAWPAELEVSLKGFRNLESFVVCAGERCFETDLRSAPRARVREGRDERWTTELEVPVRVFSDSILVVVPAAALTPGRDRLELGWVEEYR